MREKILEAFYFRHACKDFDTEKKIPDEDFNLILEAGRLSPSSFGFEPWVFLIVQNPELREKLRGPVWSGQKQIPNSSHLVVYLTRKSRFMRYDSEYVKKFMCDVQMLPEDMCAVRREFYENFQRKDFDLLGSERAMFDWAARQVYIALANMMTAAALLRIDSCPIEGFSLKDVNGILAEHFGVDTENFGVACMCAFGYRVKEPREKTRQPMERVSQWFR